MNNRTGATIASFAFAAAWLILAFKKMPRGQVLETPDGIGEAIVLFLPAFPMLLLGVWLLLRKAHPPK